jgi:GlpG protein
MRLIWSTEQLDTLKGFSELLSAKGIDHIVDEISEKNWDHPSYGCKQCRLWIVDEDFVEEAKSLLQSYLESPTPIFKANKVPATISKNPAQRYIEQKLQSDQDGITSLSETPKIWLTNFIVAICSILLLLTIWSEKDIKNIPEQAQKVLITVSPIEKILLFDYPEKNELLDKIIALYGTEAILKPQELPPPGKFLYLAYTNAKSWQGMYSEAVVLASNLFNQNIEQVRQGQFWRLFSPILLHGDLLHLFFNMIWLLILGIQMERHLGIGKYLLFILIVAMVSNTCQYFVSGPAFLGFSGVICGMAFFVRGRQKSAPWEGYLMSSSTFQFLVFFICSLFVLSLLAFILEVFHWGSFPILIANTAHIVGAFIGYILAKSNFFRAENS